ncbi:MAG: TIGR00266 family protein [Chloroflexi bacterium]|nr:TIGR00266 family protein [Chloroflexota bacterium]
MRTDIAYRPAYSLGILRLEPNERVRVEAGSMVSFSQGVSLETKASGGIMASLRRALLGGESFFINEYAAPDEGGTLNVAPALPGDLFSHELEPGSPLLVQSGSFVASSMDVEVDTRWGGARTFFASEGLFVLRCSGAGTLVLSSYGAIHEMILGPGEVHTVDTGHLVAWGEEMAYSVRAIGGLKSSLFSGEGLVVDLTGPGRILMQTRSTDALISWMVPEVQRRLPRNNR